MPRIYRIWIRRGGIREKNANASPKKLTQHLSVQDLMEEFDILKKERDSLMETQFQMQTELDNVKATLTGYLQRGKEK